jgi:hypothetical protein
VVYTAVYYTPIHDHVMSCHVISLEGSAAQAALDASDGDVEAAVGWLVAARRLEQEQQREDGGGGGAGWGGPLCSGCRGASGEAIGQQFDSCAFVFSARTDAHPIARTLLQEHKHSVMHSIIARRRPMDNGPNSAGRSQHGCSQVVEMNTSNVFLTSSVLLKPNRRQKAIPHPPYTRRAR